MRSLNLLVKHFWKRGSADLLDNENNSIDNIVLCLIYNVP